MEQRRQTSCGANKRSAKQRSPKRLWQQADHDHRKALIVDIALKLLDRHGLEAVTVRRVAQKLGVGTMTLYTYFTNQRELKRAIVRRGFEMLNEFCESQGTLATEQLWRGGSHSYVHFAVAHPNLYRLMFQSQLAKTDADLFHGGFQLLLNKVMITMPNDQLSKDAFRKQAIMAAGRYWIALHGIATLATTGRLCVLERELDEIIDDMIGHIAPEVRISGL